MRKRLLLPLLIGTTCLPAVAAGDNGLDFDYQVSYEREALDGVTLGEDATEDRLVETDLELEFSLEYSLSDSTYLFFVGALVDETETLETLGEEIRVSGLERSQMGLAYLFGDRVQSTLVLGRSEFENTGERWQWWDEELDAIRLDSVYDDFELTVGLAEELARENTDDDGIDPELEDVRRLLVDLSWEFTDGHQLIFYYLDQRDDSSGYDVGDFEPVGREDESDADLTWTGLSYLGSLEIEDFASIELEGHLARVSGEETRYDFDDPAAGRVEVSERVTQDIDGAASGLFLSLVPARFDDWRLTLGRVRADGDGNPDDMDDDAFRQNDLQGESEVLGEVFQPELSNLVVDIVGLEWRIADGVELALYRYDYEQDELADEIRDAGIELDPNGLNRDLGHEIDLVLTVTARDGLELILTAGEFHAGGAFAASDPADDRSGEVAGFVKFEIGWEF